MHVVYKNPQNNKQVLIESNSAFISAPLLWHQILIIHANVSGETWVPVAFSLLPNKEYDAYFRLFDGLKSYMVKIGLPKVAASYVMSDFETGMNLDIITQYIHL